MSAKQLSLKERLDRHSIPEPNSGCWLWTGHLDAYGYGSIHNREAGPSKKLKAHRVAYAEFIGPIPEGKLVCHSCDTRSCVNPRHLWIGSHEDNQNDRVLKDRSAKGSDFHRSTLKECDIPAIRMASGPLAEISKAFGISKQVASDIRRRATWKHVL